MNDIMIERVVRWDVNLFDQPPFLCTPEHLDELAIGHLLALGVIKEDADVLCCAILPGKPELGYDTYMQVGLCSGCDPTPRDIITRLNALSPIQSDFTVSKSEIKAMCGRLLSNEDYFGVHRLMLAHKGSEVFREDVGRHNAADKLLAYASRSHWDYGQCVLGATGRISLEMLSKAAQVGIPVFFSRKYPSDSAILWAEKLRIALVSRAHSDDMQVFGAVDRIL